MCVHKSETHSDKDGVHIVQQAQNCSTVDRPQADPDGRLLGDGNASTGSVVDCSNEAQLPKGFKKPAFGF